MPTINQLLRKPRKPQVKRNKVPAMEACPQKEGYAQESIQQLLKNQILHLGKSQGLDSLMVLKLQAIFQVRGIIFRSTQ